MDTAKAEKRELNEGEQRDFNLLQSLIDNIRSEENNGQGNAKPTENQGEQPTEPEGARQFDTGYSANDAAQITSLCRSFNVDATEYLQKGMSLDSVRAARCCEKGVLWVLWSKCCSGCCNAIWLCMGVYKSLMRLF